jgi:hypothetical protein
MRPLPGAGGAGISARTLGMIFFAKLAEVFAPFAVKSFSPRRALRKSSLAAAAWVCPKDASVGNSIHYRACEERKGFMCLSASFPTSSGSTSRRPAERQSFIS